jgi:hypothetical protein
MPTSPNVSLAGARLVGTDPEGVQRTVSQVEPEANRLAGKGREVFILLPIDKYPNTKQEKARVFC